MSYKKLGIVIALFKEAKSILEDPFYGWVKKNFLYSSKKFKIELIVSGIGKVYSSFALGKLNNDCEIYFSLGTAGSFEKNDIGELIIANQFVEYDMDLTGIGVDLGLTSFSSISSISSIKNPVIQSSDDELIIKLINAGNIDGIILKNKRILSGDKIITDQNEKNKLKKIFDASIIDMESAGLAKIASTILKKQFISIRYITDNSSLQIKKHWAKHIQDASKKVNQILKEILVKELLF